MKGDLKWYDTTQIEKREPESAVTAASELDHIDHTLCLLTSATREVTFKFQTVKKINKELFLVVFFLILKELYRIITKNHN